MIIFNGFKMDESIKFDKEVNVYWNCYDLQNVFCFRCLGNKPSVKNIRNSNIELYTLTDRWSDTMKIDLETAIVSDTDMNISNEFLGYVTTVLTGTDKYDILVSRYTEYKDFIDYKLKYNWESNFSNFFTKNDIYNNKYENNALCADIFENMLINVPERFNDINLNEYLRLPFMCGDYLYMIYTIGCLGVTRKYKIVINIV